MYLEGIENKVLSYDKHFESILIFDFFSITLGNKRKMSCLSGFRDVKMSKGIRPEPPNGWFSQVFVLTQVVGGGRG